MSFFSFDKIIFFCHYLKTCVSLVGEILSGTISFFHRVLQNNFEDILETSNSMSDIHRFTMGISERLYQLFLLGAVHTPWKF